MSPLLASVTPEALIQFGGRLHPLLLHIPIGLLAAVMLVEIVAIMRRKPLDQSVRMALVWMTALSAAMAMTSGLLLSREDSYGSETLQTHKLLGIGVTVGAAMMVICAMKPALRGFYALLLVATTAAMIPAGHLGGTMTHGDDFLTAPFESKSPAPKAPLNRASDDNTQDLFTATVAPVIHGKCLACHSAARHKGGLSMETADAILAGAEAGPVIVPGDAAASEMIIRLRLPIDDEGHMPPKSKPQPTEAEIVAIEQWINLGADISTQEAATPVNASKPPMAPPPAEPEIPSPSQEAIAALRAAQVHVERIDPANGLLWVDCAAAPTIENTQARLLLEPLRDFIADLSLAGTHTGDGILTLVAKMPNLQSLNISRTECTPAGLQLLKGHPSIEDLRLTQMSLDDAAIETLATLPALKRVFLWSSGISPQGADRLLEANAELLVDMGASLNAEPLETEAAIALSGEAPLPGAAPTIATLAPVNALCPVSGKAVNARFVIVHEGAIIGFCCQDCAAKFWAEPEKYPIPK